MRLVPNQNPHEIAKTLKSHIESFATDTVKVSMTIGQEAWPFEMAVESPYMEAVQQALESTINTRAKLVRTGGSIPILGMFNRIIGLPMAGWGYGEGEGIHSPNEYVVVDSFFQALEAGIRMYHNMAQISE